MFLSLATMEIPAQISTEQHFSIWKFGRICKLIPSLGQACTERHSPRLLLESKLACVSSTLKRLILSDRRSISRVFFLKGNNSAHRKPYKPSVHISITPKSEKRVTTSRTNNGELVKVRYVHKAHHSTVNESYLHKVLLISGKIYETALSGRDPEGNYICSRISAICGQKTDVPRKRKEDKTPKCEA